MLDADAGVLSKMEYVNLLEALIITSNQFNNYDKQAQFIKAGPYTQFI